MASVVTFAEYALKPQVDVVQTSPRSSAICQTEIEDYSAHQVRANVALSAVARARQVGLIGKSGCGKSTFLRLLARVYEPTRGTITIGGVSLEEVSFSRTVAVMDQEPLLFDGSLGFNISIGRESSDIQGVRRRGFGAPRMVGERYE